MKKVIPFTLALTLMLGFTACGQSARETAPTESSAATASEKTVSVESGTVQLFQMLNSGYPLSQPNLTEEEQETLVQRGLNWQQETERAHYSLTELAFDGINMDLLIEVKPKNPKQELLSSVYGDPYEIPEEGAKSDAELAEALNLQVVMEGVYVEEVGAVVSYAYRRQEDNNLLLLVHYVYETPQTGDCTLNLRLREYVYEEEAEENGDIFPLTFSANVPLTIGAGSMDIQTDWGQLNTLTLYRSPLGMLAVAEGTVANPATDGVKTALESAYLTLIDENGEELFTDFGSYSAMANGEYVLTEELTGGEIYLSHMGLAAGETLPTHVQLKLMDGSVYSVTLEGNPTN